MKMRVFVSKPTGDGFDESNGCGIGNDMDDYRDPIELTALIADLTLDTYKKLFETFGDGKHKSKRGQIASALQANSLTAELKSALIEDNTSTEELDVDYIPTYGPDNQVPCTKTLISIPTEGVYAVVVWEHGTKNYRVAFVTGRKNAARLFSSM